jgi:hypothetical protein
MLDHATTLLQAGFAILLAVSPQLLHKSDMDDVRKMYAEAQKRADYIVVTGDMAELQQIADADAALAQYQPQLAQYIPALDRAAAVLAPQLGDGTGR